MTRLLNSLFASYFLINFDFLSPHTARFGNIIIPPFIALETCKIMFFVSSPHFRQQDSIIFIHSIELHSMELDLIDLHLIELHSIELHSMKLHFKKGYHLIRGFYLKAF